MPAGRPTCEPHPLFPRDDGSLEDRDIQYVTFRRRRTGDRLVQTYPEDLPAHEVRSWVQVVAWWGGGEYKIIGKNAKLQFQAMYPAGAEAWEVFDGESKPFTLRDSSPYASVARAPVPPPPAEPPPAPPPAAQSNLEAAVAILSPSGEHEIYVGGGPNMIGAARPLTWIINVMPLRGGQAIGQRAAQIKPAAPIVIGGGYMPTAFRQGMVDGIGGEQPRDETAQVWTLMRRTTMCELLAMRDRIRRGRKLVGVGGPDHPRVAECVVLDLRTRVGTRAG